jgi:hypothetical protein
MTRRRWGKAGVRLTDEEIRRRGYQRALARQTFERNLEEARKLWAAGQVKPYRITRALNLRGLYGPEVDEACGAKEPDVDMWEAGTLYPTWEQLVKLAKLTGFTPRFFVTSWHGDFQPLRTSLRFHGYPEEDQEPLITEYPPEVWRRTVDQEGLETTAELRAEVERLRRALYELRLLDGGSR